MENEQRINYNMKSVAYKAKLEKPARGKSSRDLAKVSKGWLKPKMLEAASCALREN